MRCFPLLLLLPACLVLPDTTPCLVHEDCPGDLQCVKDDPQGGIVGICGVDADLDDVRAEDDCDDDNPAVFPGAPEVCDQVDNDCDGLADEEADETGPVRYRDVDEDGFGDPETATTWCVRPEGWVDNDRDCDDTTDAVSPEGVESCNQVDDDCDGEVDEADAVDAETFYQDGDGDGYGTADVTTEACEVPDGYADNTGDCDDAEPLAYTGAYEYNDGVDNDCDGGVDNITLADAAFSVEGRLSTSGTGLAIASGDLDGDGDLDVLIGSPTDFGAGSAAGTAFGLMSPYDTDLLRPDASWVGDVDGAQTGSALATLDDRDGDGRDEVIVGIPGTGTQAGRVMYDESAGQPYDVRIVQFQDQVWSGESGDGLGFAVTAGADRIFAGAPGGDRVYRFDPDSSVAEHVWLGPAGSQAGSSLDFVGDAFGDGTAHLLVGAPGAGPDFSGSGRAFLIPATGSDAPLADVAACTWDLETAEAQLGWSVSSAGDFDGDGREDVIVGMNAFTRGLSDAAWVLSACDPEQAADISADALVHVTRGDFLDDTGSAVAHIGDFDGDGKDDVAIGAPILDFGTGRVSIVLGGSTGTLLAADADVLLHPGGEGGRFGLSIAPAGDYDGDGFDDLWVGGDGLGDDRQGGVALFLGGPRP